MGRRTWVVGAVLALLLVPGAATGAEEGAADEATTSAEQELAETYAPVMMLVDQAEKCGPGEPYVPSDVDALFDESSIALRGPWTDRDLVTVGPSAEELSQGLEGYALDQPGDPLKPGCDYEEWADSVWGSDPQPTIYAHVATEPGVEDRIALQYFFFYPFNDYNNKHEADWERIQVEFAAPDAEAALGTEPDLVLYSQHYGAERAEWDDDKLEIADGTHPVVYVSAGSHASQYDEGLYLGRSASEGFGCDTTIGPHDEVRPAVVTIPSDLEAAAEQFPWTTYRGHWGEVGPQRFYEGPTGPNMKQAWKKPFTWSAKARDHSFSLPGAEVAGSTAGTYFCTLVGSGSDVFRRFSADPAPTLLVLLGVLLALAWVVRRSGWAEASPVPAVAERRPGQVVGAALRMLRRHWRVFLLVAAPAAVASVVSSVLAAAVPSSAWWWSVLSGVVLDIETEARRLRMVDPGRFEMPPGLQAVPVRRSGDAAMTDVTVEGAVIAAVIDTGATALLALSQEAATGAGLLDGRPERSGASIVLGGAIAARIVEARTVTVGDRLYREVDLPIYADVGLPGFPGALLGMEAFQGQRLILNTGAGTVHVSPAVPMPDVVNAR